MSLELTAGTLLRDRYRVVSLVGQGGMGAVYLTEDTRLPGRRCAVKEIRLPAGVAADAEVQAREQFHREASTLARLDHPNLPRVSDFFGSYLDEALDTRFHASMQRDHPYSSVSNGDESLDAE